VKQEQGEEPSKKQKVKDEDPKGIDGSSAKKPLPIKKEDPK